MKASKPTILILTTHTGGGHLNLAQSLKDILGATCEVAIVDPQPALVDRWYASVSRHSLKFLERQFTFTDNETASSGLHRVLTLLSFRRLHRVIERVQPALIITTHALLSYATARVNERRRERVPLVFQLTDLGRLHMTWFTETIAPYMAAADVIAGKAGASFISEAFMLEKPFLITAFIPGQETPNLQFIEQHNLGWVCLETGAQKDLLIKLASNPGMIAAKENSIRFYKSWNT